MPGSLPIWLASNSSRAASKCGANMGYRLRFDGPAELTDLRCNVSLEVLPNLETWPNINYRGPRHHPRHAHTIPYRISVAATYRLLRTGSSTGSHHEPCFSELLHPSTGSAEPPHGDLLQRYQHDIVPTWRTCSLTWQEGTRSSTACAA